MNDQKNTLKVEVEKTIGIDRPAGKPMPPIKSKPKKQEIEDYGELQKLHLVALNAIGRRRGFFGSGGAADKIGDNGVLNQAMKYPQEGLENTEIIDRIKKRYPFDKLFANRFGKKVPVRHPLGGYWRANPKSINDYTDSLKDALEIDTSKVLGNSSLLKETKTFKVGKQEKEVFSGRPQTPRMTVYRGADGTYTVDYAKADPLNKRKQLTKDLDSEVRRLFGYDSWSAYKKSNFKDLTKRIEREDGRVTSAPTVHPFHVAYGLEEFFNNFNVDDYEVLGLIPEHALIGDSSMLPTGFTGAPGTELGAALAGTYLGVKALKGTRKALKKRAAKKAAAKAAAASAAVASEKVAKKANEKVVKQASKQVAKEITKKATTKAAASGALKAVGSAAKFAIRRIPHVMIAWTIYDVVNFISDWVSPDSDLDKRAEEVPEDFLFPNKESLEDWVKGGELPPSAAGGIGGAIGAPAAEDEETFTPEDTEDSDEKLPFSFNKLKFFIVPKDWRTNRAISWLTLDEATLAMRVGANIQSGFAVGLNGKSYILGAVQSQQADSEGSLAAPAVGGAAGTTGVLGMSKGTHILAYGHSQTGPHASAIKKELKGTGAKVVRKQFGYTDAGLAKDSTLGKIPKRKYTHAFLFLNGNQSPAKYADLINNNEPYKAGAPDYGDAKKKIINYMTDTLNIPKQNITVMTPPVNTTHTYRNKVSPQFKKKFHDRSLQFFKSIGVRTVSVSVTGDASQFAKDGYHTKYNSDLASFGAKKILAGYTFSDTGSKVASIQARGAGTQQGSVPYDFVTSKLGITRQMWDVYRRELSKIESGSRDGNYFIAGGYNKHYDGRYQMGRAAKKRWSAEYWHA